MSSAQPWRQAIVLSRFDLADGHELLLHSCEDCACPVSDEQAVHRHVLPPPAAPDDSCWVRASDVAEFPLEGEYRLLFNPLSSAGVVVVNGSALDIFRDFRLPAVPGDVARSRPGRAVEISQAFGRLAQLELIHPAGQRPRPEFHDGQVLTAWLHVTNGCNLRCPYCELAAACGLRLYATLLSNGVRMPASLIQACKAEGIRVMISLDGLGDQHDIQRPFVNGKPSFQFVERTIAQLIRQDLAPHLSITVTGRNTSGVADVVRFALERELTFSINLFRDNNCAASFPDLRYEEQAITEALLKAFAVVEDLMPRWSVLGSILDRGQLLEPRQRSCGVGQDYVVIDQRGKVAKCHMEIERTLGDVFAHDPLQLVRQDRTTALNLIVDEKEGCRDCSWRYWCSGGCTVATFRATGRYDIKSPNCNIYKSIYPQALRLEGLRLLRYAASG
jgi:radical SAM protein with 4Fe4S-binding SPASM domain